MTTDHIPLWKQWSAKDHVKTVWFIEGYEPANYVGEKITGNGFDYPFIIYLDDHPIGYIVTSDLYAYRMIESNPNGIFTKEDLGTYCLDLFIGEEGYLNKGYGTQIVSEFIEYIYSHFTARQINIDPAISNKRAIRCYEKAGFKESHIENDGITDCQIMIQTKPLSPLEIKLFSFLDLFIPWVYSQPDIIAAALVGSYARGEAKASSDIDLMLLTNKPDTYLNHREWLNTFGIIDSVTEKEYGETTSLHTYYRSGLEVEFSISPPSWANLPLDAGTKSVIERGFKIIVDKTGNLKNLLEQTSTN